MHFSLFPAQGRGGADGLIVRLASPAGKNDFPTAGAENPGHRFPGFLQNLFGALAKGVQAGGVAVVFPHHGNHGLHGRLAHPGGGGVVRINHAYNTSGFIVRKQRRGIR